MRDEVHNRFNNSKITVDKPCPFPLQIRCISRTFHAYNEQLRQNGKSGVPVNFQKYICLRKTDICNGKADCLHLEDETEPLCSEKTCTSKNHWCPLPKKTMNGYSLTGCFLKVNNLTRVLGADILLSFYPLFP